MKNKQFQTNIKDISTIHYKLLIKINKKPKYKFSSIKIKNIKK